MAVNIIRHIAPSFIINKVKGWNTRLIYKYYGSTESPLQVDPPQIENLFTTIANTSTSNNPLYKGQHIFPGGSRYFKTGKSIRIKGRFWITGTSGEPFNIWAGVKFGNTGLKIASSNNGTNHTLPASLVDCPVDFEITYNSIENNSSQLYLDVNGFYQYSFGNYKTTGANVENSYVPIWDDKGTYTAITSVDEAIELVLSFDSSTIPVLTLIYLTIEELQ